MLASLLSLLSLTSLPHVAVAIFPRDAPTTPSLPGIDAFLTAHNTIRAQHKSLPLEWSAQLASMGANWAGRCVFARTEGVLNTSPYGELHVAGTGLLPIDSAIHQFAKDGEDYNPAKPTYNHFTQIVWKSTTQVGCAISQCNDLLGLNTGLATYYVCLYDPPGNVIGQAPGNVQVDDLA